MWLDGVVPIDTNVLIGTSHYARGLAEDTSDTSDDSIIYVFVSPVSIGQSEAKRARWGVTSVQEKVLTKTVEILSRYHRHEKLTALYDVFSTKEEMALFSCVNDILDIDTGLFAHLLDEPNGAIRAENFKRYPMKILFEFLHNVYEKANVSNGRCYFKHICDFIRGLMINESEDVDSFLGIMDLLTKFLPCNVTTYATKKYEMHNEYAEDIQNLLEKTFQIDLDHKLFKTLECTVAGYAVSWAVAKVYNEKKQNPHFKFDKLPKESDLDIFFSASHGMAGEVVSEHIELLKDFAETNGVGPITISKGVYHITTKNGRVVQIIYGSDDHTDLIQTFDALCIQCYLDFTGGRCQMTMFTPMLRCWDMGEAFGIKPMLKKRFDKYTGRGLRVRQNLLSDVEKTECVDFHTVVEDLDKFIRLSIRFANGVNDFYREDNPLNDTDEHYVNLESSSFHFGNVVMKAGEVFDYESDVERFRMFEIDPQSHGWKAHIDRLKRSWDLSYDFFVNHTNGYEFKDTGYGLIVTLGSIVKQMGNKNTFIARSYPGISMFKEGEYYEANLTLNTFVDTANPTRRFFGFKTHSMKHIKKGDKLEGFYPHGTCCSAFPSV
jgi:hypothetical protein